MLTTMMATAIADPGAGGQDTAPPRPSERSRRRTLDVHRHLGREVVQQVPQPCLHHPSSGSTWRRRSSPRDTVDFTVPSGMPSASAVSASLKSS